MRFRVTSTLKTEMKPGFNLKPVFVSATRGMPPAAAHPLPMAPAQARLKPNRNT